MKKRYWVKDRGNGYGVVMDGNTELYAEGLKAAEKDADILNRRAAMLPPGASHEQVRQVPDYGKKGG